MATTAVRIGSRPRRWPVYLLVGAVSLAIVFTILSGFVIDVLWFREVDKSSVYWTTLQTKALLGVVFGAAFFALLYVNLLIAQWLTPQTRVLTPDQEVLERIRDSVDPYVRWLLPLGALVLAVFVGIGVSGEWDTFALWRNSADITFGRTEEQFGRDPAFYVFTLPWLRFVQGWLFSSLVGVTVLTALAHVVWGGIRPQAPVFADKVAPAVRAHLSVLLGLIFLVKAWGYWIGRFDLLTSHRGYVQGASYTDVNAQIPALTFLTVVAVICAVLFFVNIRVRLWSLPVIAVVLLGVVSVLLGAAYPAFVQQFRVRPNEQQYERDFIGRNIAGTRAAFGLDQIVQEQRDVGTGLSVEQRAANEITMENIRLWRPSILLESFQSLQRIRQYYEFPDIDVDRYETADGLRLLMLSPREIIQRGIPQSGQTWTNQHLTYTHGFGVVAAQVNTATTEGQPRFTLQDIPPQGDPPVPPIDVERAGIYFGEIGAPDTTPFVVVGTPNELDYEGGGTNPYAGDGGIPVGNLVQRAMFAWKYRDVNLLTTGQITDSSRILINRDIETRVPKAAPFLGFDADPYMAVIDGEAKWIWDAYTVSNEYPYSESIDVATALDLRGPPAPILPAELNYIRNSVKVVVDAYDGEMTYYADLSEPIVAAWARVFPGLLTDISEASDSLEAHFRYPENLFQIQATHYANYHVTDPDVFYQKQDFWQVPADPTQGVQATTEGTVTPVATTDTVPRLRPSYMLSRLPDDTEEAFRLVLPFVPEGRANMVAWLTASSDPDDYGSLIAYRFPTGRNIEGPSQIFARMNQDEAFSRERTLLGQTGSQILFGDFLVIPVEDTFLYVQPVYVRAQQQASLPELKFVLVVNGSGQEVSIGSTLDEALDAAIGDDGEEPPEPTEPGEPTEPTEPVGPIDRQIEQLLAEALTHFVAADEALREGDLATYQQEIAEAEALVAQAEALVAARGGGGQGGDGQGGDGDDAEASPAPDG
ncbi:MAG TPA: UPF0182 family protein [Actinomycetota bacterium]|nr:UPF0182 family protein [Actinomycetota bacterium]